MALKTSLLIVESLITQANACKYKRKLLLAQILEAFIVKGVVVLVKKGLTKKAIVSAGKYLMADPSGSGLATAATALSGTAGDTYKHGRKAVHSAQNGNVPATVYHTSKVVSSVKGFNDFGPNSTISGKELFREGVKYPVKKFRDKQIEKIIR